MGSSPPATTPPLSDAEVAAVAEQLVDADRRATPVEALTHEPIDVADGYRIQAAVHQARGTAPVAWKAGCTNTGIQQLLKIDAPLFGRYGHDRIEASPANLDARSFVGAPSIEVEVGLRLVRDVTDVPLDPLGLADAVEAFAAIEVVDARIAGFPMITAAQLVADNVAGSRMIVGPSLGLGADGLRALDTVPVTLTIDGDEVATGSGAEALGHPLRVLRDLALHAGLVRQPLRAGDVVITGTCTGVVPARLGHDHVGRVGDVEVVVRIG